MSDDRVTLNDFRVKVQASRLRRGWSREAAALTAAMRPQTLSEIESGKRVPSPEHIARLCQLYELDLERWLSARLRELS